VNAADLIVPDWPAPSGVRAAFTLRTGGVSAPPFASLNLGAHVGDDPRAVAENRARVRKCLALPGEPVWLEQAHGCRVLDLDRPDGAGRAAPGPADAALTRATGRVCVIQVADCLPVLLAAADGSAVAAAHAGWRGLAAGVLESTVQALGVPPRALLAWLGPAISQPHFEVGEEVRAAFLAHDPLSCGAFLANARGRWQCDLNALARGRLAGIGVRRVHGGLGCTFADAGRFYSYRREGRCGRMAALIWRE
jgi:YfiH family protein